MLSHKMSFLSYDEQTKNTLFISALSRSTKLPSSKSLITKYYVPGTKYRVLSADLFCQQLEASSQQVISVNACLQHKYQRCVTPDIAVALRFGVFQAVDARHH